MKSGKNLGIAYSVKKKAKGGKVDKLHQGAQEARKYSAQKQEKGVHTPDYPYPHSKESMGSSYAGRTASSPVDHTGKAGVEARTGKPVSKQGMNEEAKKEHRRVLSESRSMPKPNLPMAEGGMIDKKSATTAQRGPKTIPLKHPSMQQSPVFRTKLRDQEDDLEMLAKGGNVTRHDNEKGVHAESHTRKLGQSEAGDTLRTRSTGSRLHREVADDAIRAEHVKRLNESRSMPKPNLPMAEGGEVSEIDGGAEESMDHEDSMADAIMARRDRLHEEIDSGAHDLDSAVRMAEGGEVDIDENAEEQPNEFYDLNEDAALKENFDSDMDDVSQPKDSNEDGHILSDEDSHDMVDKIRSGMKKRQR